MPKTISYPIAKDEKDEWVDIDSAQPDGSYYCPECRSSFVVRKGRVRKHHFAHKPGRTGLCTGESGYHSLAKHVLAFHFERKKELAILSKCPECSRVLGGKKRIEKVEVEKGEEEYRSDVKLTLEGGTIINCEVVYRNPLDEKVTLYRDSEANVLVWQIEGAVEKVPPLIQYSWANVSGETLRSILHRVKDKLLLFTSLSPYKHECTPYGRAEISEGDCWKCGRSIRVASITFWYPRWDSSNYQGEHESWKSFSRIPTGLWKKLNKEFGTNLRNDQSNTIQSSYLMNHCSKCGAKIGDFFLYRYGRNRKKIEVEFSLTDWERREVEKYKRQQHRS